MYKKITFLLIFISAILSGAQSSKQNCVFHNHMIKNDSRTKQASKQSLVPISSDLMKNFMILYCDLETLGRLGRACKEYQKLYESFVVCKIPLIKGIKESPCNSLMCQISSRDFDHCTDILAIYAKKIIKSEQKDIQSLWRFKHLWQYHAAERVKGVADVLEIENPTIDQCIRLYAGKYDKDIKKNIKAGKIVSLHEWQLEALGKANFSKISQFFDEENNIAIKTIFLANPQLYCDNRSERDIFLEKVYDFDDISVIRKVYYRGSIDWKEIIYFAWKCKKYERVFSLIKQHGKYIGYRKFEIWGQVVSLKIAPLYPIVDLLFADNINEISIFGWGLLHRAIYKKDKNAVKFLLNRKANVNQLDSEGYSPLYEAVINNEIILLLLQYDANINQQNRDGKTVLMNTLSSIGWNEAAEKVFNTLLEYGADVNILDDYNESALYYLIRSSDPSKQHSRIISKLIEYGASIDIKNKLGQTPLDYAKGFENQEAVAVLTQVITEKYRNAVQHLRQDFKNKAEDKFNQEQLLAKNMDNKSIKVEIPIKKESASSYKKLFLYGISLTTLIAATYFFLHNLPFYGIIN